MAVVQPEMYKSHSQVWRHEAFLLCACVCVLRQLMAVVQPEMNKLHSQVRKQCMGQRC